jgi:hypothetical protein
MSEILTAEHFRPHVGKVFRFEGTPHAYPLDRIETSSQEPPPGYPRRPFTLVFAGPRGGAMLAEGMYEAQVEDGPAFALYVMPVHTPRPDRQEYQAAFN